ncbi:hypothetical protein OBBRIDRAFT_889761 [Obba rivulosa]|uniref:F-box protein n=1 Tax=Obba rivulosa TaxID=1052685 RepID=A0A8E2DGU0_9APHY|nr:hypothetical protein OBBRIDRAFT_889761 [Obba rivulosa]
MKFSDLSGDVIDRIFINLPDYTTLSTVLRASKQLNEVYIRHPKSIKRAIANNIVGPAWPAAVRAAMARTLDLENIPGEEELRERDIELSREGLQVQLHAEKVKHLEDLYSWRHKDRTSSTSKLTPEESFRFRRALYRFWLYVLTMRQYELDFEGSEFAEECVDFLSNFSSDELYELGAVTSFLKETIEWVMRADHVATLPDHHAIEECRLMFASEPETVAFGFEACILEADVEVASDDLADEFFDRNFNRVLEDRNIDGELREKKIGAAILTSVTGAQDKCDRCSAQEGVSLWGSTNWTLLKGCLNPREMCDLLDALLPRNKIEVSPIIDDMKGKVDEFDYKGMIEEMLEMEPDPLGMWSKDQWYCLECVRELFRQRFRKWLLARKLNRGSALQDCWYGYNCTTQTKTADHAKRLNHLCEPTRGNAPPP